MAERAVEEKDTKLARKLSREAGPLAERSQNSYALAKLESLRLWPPTKRSRPRRS